MSRLRVLIVSATTVFAISALGVVVPAPVRAAPGPPSVDTARVPADSPPGPEGNARQTKGCAGAGVLADSDLTQPPPPALTLQLASAHRLSTGAGVAVAVIDTGVRAQPRLPNLVGGGDYVTAGGDGLSDCDAHGTLVAGIIGAAASPADGFVGVAPDAQIISIRQSSDAFSADLPPGTDPNDPNAGRAAIELRALARAVVHAANMNARVITISNASCVDAASGIDQGELGAALWYAASVRDAVIVAAAGNTSSGGSPASSSCGQNPPESPATPADPRGWGQIKTVSSPAVFSQHVLSVGFTSPTGTPSQYSLRGPWLGLAAPGTAIVSLNPLGGDGVVNGVAGANNGTVPVAGSSYAAAYVAGAAALVRARFPQLNAQQVIDRLTRTAHAPARGVDNTVGAGLLDPPAALSADVPVDGSGVGRFGSSALPPPAPDPAPDRLPRVVALTTACAALILGCGLLGLPVVLRRRKQAR
ncbi:type VII secretion-associated serine protease mycosin [Nocardia brasiliensis]|uniref:type VII secretion-associated serine protease mycosin n=1 Tax=Nocardia brasiliensis TaxID=37326 RepID=UPI002458B788|nr:type VII secretion-associated serine protease mycosin [Nocardia brasiliensis]